MSSSNSIYSLLSQLTSLPILILLIVGLVMAVSRQQKHPRVSLFAAAAMVAGIVQVILGFGFQYWATHAASNGTAEGLPMAAAGFSILRMLLACAGWGLALAAIFSDREPATTPRA